MNSRGISTIELLVALTITTMALTASIYTMISTPEIIANAKSAAAALHSSYVHLGTASSTTDTALEDTQFSLRVSNMDWSTTRGETHLISLSRLIHTPIEPEECDPFNSGNWSNIGRATQYVLNRGLLIPSYSGTYTIAALATTPNSLAVVAASTSDPTSPTTFFFSLSGTTTPKLIGAFDTATTSRIGGSAVAMHDTYAFVGNAFSSSSSTTCADGTSCAQVISFNVTGARAALLSSLMLSTSTEPYAQTGNGANAPTTSLAYSDGYVYLGLQKTVAGDEFNIVDAHDPAHLRWIAGYPIGRTVNNVYVRDGYAYIATDDPERELMIFDVHDPAHPALLSTWDSPGPSTFGYGSAATAFGNNVRFGKTYTAHDPEFEVLNVGVNNAISVSSSYDPGTTRDAESVRALLTQDRLTFTLLTRRLVALDTHDPNHTHIVGTYDFGPGKTGVALACRNNQLYVAENANGGVGIIEILQGK